MVLRALVARWHCRFMADVPASPRNVYGRTLLQEALVQKKKGMLKFILAVDRATLRDVYDVDYKGWSAVHYAAFDGDLEALMLLHARGANLNKVVPVNGLTPLILAAIKGHFGVVQYLLENGADSQARTVDGERAMDIVRRISLISISTRMAHLLADARIDDPDR